MSLFLVWFLRQVGDFARLLYTNWTDPDDGRHRFEAIRRLASDMEVRCPANLMASIVSKRHPVYMCVRIFGDSLESLV